MSVVKCPTCKHKHCPEESIVTMEDKPDLHKNNSTMKLKVKCWKCGFPYYLDFETRKLTK